MLIDSVIGLKKLSSRLLSVNIDTRNRALAAVSEAIVENKSYILSENKKDLDSALNINGSLYKRLVLTNNKIDEIVEGLKTLISLPDPLGKMQMNRELDSGLTLSRYSVPIGVVGVIFESRPDALVQISSLFLKSGNCGILKGGKEAINTNRALFKIITDAVNSVSDILGSSLQLAESREDINEILKLDQYIDLMIPRGGNDLVQYIKNNTKIPVLGHTDGICHLFMDGDGDIDLGVKVTVDSKCQYPAACNAIETLLVDEKIAERFLPEVQKALNERNVELRGCKKTQSIINVNKATDEDWDTEYNDFILSIKVVSNLEEAIDHINTHGSGHTDCIVTQNEQKWDNFFMSVDSASVYLNASTRFADGNRYGFGAEVGISTNKIHSRGPVGLEGLTIYKYKLTGNGNIVDDYATGKKSFTHKELQCE